MTTIKTITKSDLNDRNEFEATSLVFDGHIEIEAGLGVVKFVGKLIASCSISAETGSGIEAGEGIKGRYAWQRSGSEKNSIAA